MGAVLDLVGTGPAQAILGALGRRPLRTRQLTDRITAFSARSVYRCIGKLEAQQLIERNGAAARSRAPLRLTEPTGRNLFQLLRSLTTEARAATGAFSGDSLRLLGQLWEMDFVGQLSRGQQPFLYLLDSVEGLSYHQARYRTARFVDDGLLERCSQAGNGNGKHYELSDRSRRCMAVIIGIGRWRHRYFAAAGTPGLEIEELATALRTALPLIKLPGYAGRYLDLFVAGTEDKYGNRETGVLNCAVSTDGTIRITDGSAREPDGSAAATINTWFAVLLDGNRGRVRVRGDLGLVDACLTQLYDALWTSPAH